MTSSAQRDILVAGHSHIAALGIALGSNDTPARVVDVPGSTRLCGLTGPWVGDRPASYWDTLVQFAGVSTVVIVYNGNQHNALHLLAADPPFDFVCATRPDLPLIAGAKVVPLQMIRRSFEPSVIGLTRITERLLSTGTNVVALGTPAPKKDLIAKLNIFQQSGFWRKLAQSSGMDPANPRITPPPLLLKLWTMVQRVTEEAVTKVGGSFLPVPPSSLDSEGYLREEYSADDFTHANLAYGALVCRYLEEVVPRR